MLLKHKTSFTIKVTHFRLTTSEPGTLCLWTQGARAFEAQGPFPVGRGLSSEQDAAAELRADLGFDSRKGGKRALRNGPRVSTPRQPDSREDPDFQETERRVTLAWLSGLWFPRADA